MQLKFLTWPDIEEYLKRDDRIILPLGSTEQHGPRAVFGTDHLIPEAIAKEVAERTGTIVAPTMAYGMSIHHMEFKGSVTLRPSTMIPFFRDLLWSFQQGGFKRVLILNGHGGNRNTVEAMLSEVGNELLDMKIKFRSWWEAEGVKNYLDEHFGEQEGHHGSPSETSQIMFLYPGVVKDRETEYRPMIWGKYFINKKTFPKLYPDGLMGSDPSLASEKHGENIYNLCVNGFVKEMDEW
ncbi:MAG: creatininase family protein [bacterium]